LKKEERDDHLKKYISPWNPILKKIKDLNIEFKGEMTDIQTTI